jgi:hypothetical protein
MVSYYLHMDEKYLWRWYCIDQHGSTVCVSNRTYFTRHDAEYALMTFRQGPSNLI